MNVAFLDFWFGFQPENNFFIHLIRSIKDNVNIAVDSLKTVVMTPINAIEDAVVDSVGEIIDAFDVIKNIF